MQVAEVATHAKALPPRTAAAKYMPGLDVLRGLAIVLVLFEHGLTNKYIAFWKTGNPVAMALYSVAWSGVSGVYLFFVLSGFLITGILLDSKHQPDYYRGFYVRRALRIVPAYLMLLVLLKATHLIDWPYTGVALLYLANVCSLFHVKPQFGPLWSLSVEEQFYLTWPLVVRRFSHRALLWISVGIVGLVPVFRLLLEHGPKFVSDWQHKTWGVADFFGAGAVLAIGVRSPRMTALFRKAAWPLLGLGAILLTIVGHLPPASGREWRILQHATSTEPYVVFWFALVLLAYLNPQIAKWRPLGCFVFLADISYGLYLIHQVLFDWVEHHWAIRETTPWATFGTIMLRFAVMVAVSCLVAWVSRRTVEAYFLRKKPKRAHPIEEERRSYEHPVLG